MIKQYPRPYMTIAHELYKTLRQLQEVLSGRDASSRLKQIDRFIAHILALRAELNLSLHDALLAEEIYAVVYRCAVTPSQHAFIYTLAQYFHPYEVSRSG